jgi:lipopolysaccharide biosynthesis regulator YciM
MLKRFVGFVLLGSVVLGVGFLFHLNPTAVEFRLTPSRTYSLPVPLLLLAGFFAGASAIFLLALVRETQWTLADRRRRKRDARLQRYRAWVRDSRELLWHGRTEPAKRALRRAPAEQRSVDSILSLAEAALAADRPDEARLLVEESLAVHPEDPRLLAQLAETHVHEGDRRGATTLLERAAARAPDSPRVVAALRDAYIREQRWEPALRAEERYLALLRRPEEIAREQRRRLGLRHEVALQRDSSEETIRDLYAILRAAPGYLPAAVSLGDLLERGGRASEAGRVWTRAARVRPSPVVLSRIEAVYRSLGRPQKIVAFYRRLRRRSDSPLLARRLARWLLAEGAADQAAAELAAAPTDGLETGLLRAEIERRRGHSAEALQLFSSAFEEALGGEAPHVCEECGRRASRWESRCPRCGNWDTLTPVRPPP